MINFLFALLLFGLVIFVHELGHFLVARVFGVKILVFSLGFGPSLVSWRRGETEYRISAVPLGGYVKMLGEHTTEEPVAPEDLPRSFGAQTWWKKVLIVLAGPVTNFLFAALVYLLISTLNYTSDASLVEFVSPTGPAATAGMHEGDRILSINGKSTTVWEDVQNALSEPQNGQCLPLSVSVARWPDRRIETLTVHPEKRRYADVLGTEIERCIMGIAAMPRDTRVALVAPFEKVLNGDIIRAIDGRPVSRWYEVISSLTPAPHAITIERNGVRAEESLSAEETQQARTAFRHGGMLIGAVEEGSVAHRATIKTNDLIVAVNNVTVDAPFEFGAELKKAREGDTVTLSIYRDGTPEEKSIVIALDATDNHYTGMKETSVRWGAQFLFDHNIEPTQLRRADPFSYSIRYMVDETIHVSVLTVKGIYYLIAGKLPAKSIGGPILIFDISQKAAERGIKVFLSVMAMISINLGILNLLPVPVLDGGHALMYTYEGIRRRKIPERAKEWSLRFGVALLLALMVFALFNDISRYISIFRNG